MQVGDKVLVDQGMLEHPWYPCDEFVANSTLIRTNGHRTITHFNNESSDPKFHWVQLDGRPFMYHPTSLRTV